MWTNAASVSDKYKDLMTLFHSRARNYGKQVESTALFTSHEWFQISATLTSMFNLVIGSLVLI